MKLLYPLIVLLLSCSTDPKDGAINNFESFYVSDINTSTNGISSTTNILIEFSNSLDLDDFILLNETYTDSDGDVIEQDFTSALKYFEQESSFLTLNNISHNFWYDDLTNTIAIIMTSMNNNCTIEDGILNENENNLFLSNLIKDIDGNPLIEVEYIITKDSQVNLCIAPNPTNINSLLKSENGSLNFYMDDVPEEYTLNIYDLNDNLISSQDNNHIAAELNTYAQWSGGTINPEFELSYGFYKIKLFNNYNNLLIQNVIVISY